MKRYLITTADERSWKFDRPVLFLGEWCRLYNRKHIWAGMDAEVASPYGIAKEQKDRDLQHVQSFATELLPEVTATLNRFHGTEHSQRYWHIVIGQWLQRFVAVAFNRYWTIKKAIADYEISGTTVFDRGKYTLATSDSSTFVMACNDDEWNHVFYADAMRDLAEIPTDVDDNALAGRTGFAQAAATSVRRPNAKSKAIALATKVLPKIARDTDAFVINPYLSTVLKAKLELALGQAPQLWDREPIKASRIDAAARKEFRLDEPSHQGFERFVRRNLAEVIPACYVEGFADLVSQTKELEWPSRPAFIFTSNNFDTDEVFKVWTASKTETGTPYFVGQHGNNYGTLKGSENWTEVVTPNAFFTWGWSNGNSRNVPAFVFKTAGRKAPQMNARGGLLLIELPLPHRLTPHDNYEEFVTYQEEQFRFVEALPERIRAQVTVRLHPGSAQMRWYEDARWADRCPGTRVDSGAATIVDLIQESRLVMHSYDSTGILEGLAWNLPTMCFWQNGFDHLLSHAHSYYDLLREVGIIADSPEEAARLTAARWDNITGWWQSRAVQSARDKFCAEYARTVEHPVRTLRRLLLSRAQLGKRSEVGGEGA